MGGLPIRRGEPCAWVKEGDDGEESFIGSGGTRGAGVATRGMTGVCGGWMYAVVRFASAKGVPADECSVP